MTSPRTPATVPTSPDPPGRSTCTSTDEAGRRTRPGLHELVQRTGDRRRGPRRPAAPAAGRRGRPPHRGTSSALAPASWACSTRSAICHCSSASRSIGMASSNSRVLLRSETFSRSRRKARTGCRRNRSSWSNSIGLPSKGGSGSARNGGGAWRGVSAASAPARCRESKLHGPSPARARGSKLRGSNGWSGCSTTIASRARPEPDRAGVRAPCGRRRRAARRPGRPAGEAGSNARRGPSR